MLCVDRNDDRLKLTALRFMDRHSIRKRQFGEILFRIRYDLAARSKMNPATIVFRIDRLNPSDVAVEDPKIVIISRLDHAIALPENLLPDRDLTSVGLFRVHRLLNLLVYPQRAKSSSNLWSQNLNLTGLPTKFWDGLGVEANNRIECREPVMERGPRVNFQEYMAQF